MDAATACDMQANSFKMLRTLSLIALIMALPRSGASFSVFTDDAVSPAVASRVSKLLRSVDTAVESAGTDQEPSLGDEGFRLEGDAGGNQYHLQCSANTPSASSHSVGLSYCLYTALELFRIYRLHPLEATLPPVLNTSIVTSRGSFSQMETPYWAVRQTHYHTEHPLELTDVLNGFNSSSTEYFPFGLPSASDPEAYFESWESMLPQVELFAEWLVANKQNRISWILLWTEKWNEFATSTLRLSRLQKLTALFTSFGLLVGADTPIAEIQQHGWYMVTDNGTQAEQEAAIREHIDWCVKAGFTFLTTESGFSEFTHPDDVLMLRWMNYTAEYTTQTYNMPVYIKCHCSTDQYCTDYKDPRTGKPLNFNFLPIYATTDMGIMPHTVQVYGWDDPAPTYGNYNFTYMFDFMFYEAKQNTGREVVFHAETGYWVNYDVDVPLFLPLYADRRLYDMRKIAVEEVQQNFKLTGENNFDSGWEWGYWLNSVGNARAVWNPYIMAQTQRQAFTMLLNSFFGVFGDAAAPMAELVADITEAQLDLLVYGNTTGAGVPGGRGDSAVVKRNGMAYLVGWDTWSELAFGGTQPSRVAPESISNSSDPSYDEIKPLLKAMRVQFEQLLSRMDALRPRIAPGGLGLYEEMCDSLNMTFYRAVQASEVVHRREQHLRTPINRTAGWRAGPTSYNYGYIWTAHSLFYFWRDWARVNNVVHPPSSPDYRLLSPCYLNYINGINVVIGDNWITDLAQDLRNKYGNETGWDAVVDCLGPPKDAWVFPRDL